MVGYAVGLGNVWRFPYLVYENGGGAFLVPYFIMLFLAGIPIFFLEVCIAQFSSQGPIGLWNIAPAFRGIGIMMVIFNLIGGVYYNTIIGYSVFYFFSTLEEKLPWSDCSGYWATNTSCTDLIDTSNTTVSASETYFHHALQSVPMDDKNGHTILWHIVIAALLSWFVIFFSLIRGIKSSGKVVWFTALFPYAVLVALFFRGVTLPGASTGLSYYIGSGSDWEKIKDADVWRKAATQIFFSLSAGWGGLQALSSYNKFHNNAFRDTMFVCLVNCGTSVFAGFAIFSM